jgi:imidazolonepropionase-like amidohydrolase
LKTHVARTSSVLFENVRIFDGRAATLSAPSHVLIRGNKIVRVALSPIGGEDRDGATVIDGADHTLMPGLIDAHAHMIMESIPLGAAMTSEASYLHILAGQAAGKHCSAVSPLSAMLVAPPSLSNAPSTRGSYPGPASIRRAR